MSEVTYQTGVTDAVYLTGLLLALSIGAGWQVWVFAGLLAFNAALRVFSVIGRRRTVNE